MRPTGPGAVIITGRQRGQRVDGPTTTWISGRDHPAGGAAEPDPERRRRSRARGPAHRRPDGPRNRRVRLGRAQRLPARVGRLPGGARTRLGADTGRDGERDHAPRTAGGAARPAGGPAAGHLSGHRRLRLLGRLREHLRDAPGSDRRGARCLAGGRRPARLPHGYRPRTAGLPLDGRPAQRPAAEPRRNCASSGPSRCTPSRRWRAPSARCAPQENERIHSRLLEASPALAACASLDDLLATACDTVVPDLGFQRMAAYLADDHDQLALACCSGWEDREQLAAVA